MAHNVIIYNLSAHLLVAAQMAGKIFMHNKVCGLLNQPPCRAGGIDFVPAEYVPVCDTKVFHQLFLVIMGNQTDIHSRPPSNNDFVSLFLMFSIRPTATMFVHMELPP